MPWIFMVVAFLLAVPAEAQITGSWITTDDKDGRQKSIIEIYEQDGRYFGKVVRLLQDATHTICRKCPGELKDKPLVGMVLLSDVKKSGTGGKDGKILDPESGNFYSCDLELLTPDQLKMRGYLGIPTFGRSQIWTRAR